MVAECLGKLATIDPEKIIPELAKLCSGAGGNLVRWTAITALKSCMTSGNALSVWPWKVYKCVDMSR
jgi:hypothetical protein